jgi:hypothetical protein
MKYASYLSQLACTTPPPLSMVNMGLNIMGDITMFSLINNQINKMFGTDAALAEQRLLLIKAEFNQLKLSIECEIDEAIRHDVDAYCFTNGNEFTAFCSGKKIEVIRGQELALPTMQRFLRHTRGVNLGDIA